MLAKRPPIIVVLGHIDHGKTTLLHYIRKTNVAVREAGGITQSIGAYEIEHRGQRLTFIDTPGHEAFKAMRRRGTMVADLGIVVVAVDDSVQKQTKEAFTILQEGKTPFIVALNKIDREGIDLNKVKADLAQVGILLEGYGGTVSWQATSAKTGQGVSELLDLIVLATDMESLIYDSAAPGRGFILESHIDSSRGIIASAIITDGQLTVGDPLSVPGTRGKVKALDDFLGERITSAQPSMPVRILGFEELVRVGDEFFAQADGGGETAPKEVEERAPVVSNESDAEKFLVILKADTVGSLEALTTVVHASPNQQIKIMVVAEGIGDITDGDVKSAIAHRATIVGFRTKMTKAAAALAKTHGVTVITSAVIYELVKMLEGLVQEVAPSASAGELEVLAVFGKKGGTQQVIGGRVVSGELRVNSPVEIQRRDQTLGSARIINLQQNKMDAPKITAGSECGLLIESEIEVMGGDHLIAR